MQLVCVCTVVRRWWTTLILFHYTVGCYSTFEMFCITGCLSRKLTQSVFNNCNGGFNNKKAVCIWRDMLLVDKNLVGRHHMKKNHPWEHRQCMRKIKWGNKWEWKEGSVKSRRELLSSTCQVCLYGSFLLPLTQQITDSVMSLSECTEVQMCPKNVCKQVLAFKACRGLTRGYQHN